MRNHGPVPPKPTAPPPPPQTLDDLAIQQLNEIEHYAHQLDHIKTLYEELLFAVEQKIPNETRHQTALRLIQQAQRGECHGYHSTPKQQ